MGNKKLKSNTKEFSTLLAQIEKEDEVVELLRECGYWDDEKYWVPFGNNENNFSTIGNQQSKPEAALVEKIINSVDAILTKECLIRGIDPESEQAPQSTEEALEDFFNVPEGQIAYLDASERSRMSRDIIFAATGSKHGPVNFVIADKGEGQTPRNVPSTILSLNKCNKLKVPFVQGKYNMGGTGVLQFCGNHRFQLVISKRCPDIQNLEKDETFDKWSVTIVRREDAREGRKSSMFTYLVNEDGEIPSFSADKLPIIPKPGNKKSDENDYEDFDFGTYFKLYNYDISCKSLIIFKLYYRLSLLIPKLAYPLKIRDSRSYAGHDLEKSLSGLYTRLHDDPKGNIVNGFPSSTVFHVEKQKFQCEIYVFEKERESNYKENEGILYIVNGQTQGTDSDSFFNSINLSYLRKSILVLVDCTDLDPTHREDMFMTSRDRLANNEFVKEVKNQIKEVLKENEGLKKLQNERREEDVGEKLKDDKPFQEVLQGILDSSPVLSRVLGSGKNLSNPFNQQHGSDADKPFSGKKHPTYFNFQGKPEKRIPINKICRVQFDTDATNDYFTRSDERGYIRLYLKDIDRTEDLIERNTLSNGLDKLKIKLPESAQVGDRYEFLVKILDDYIPRDLESEFSVEVLEEESGKENKSEHQAGKRQKKSSQNSDDGNHILPSGLEIPHIIEVHKSEWEKYNMNENSALLLKQNEGGNDYLINMDNLNLLTELKSLHEDKILLTQARFKYGMALIAMSIEAYYKNHTKDKDDSSIDLSEEVSRITSMLALVLIPIISGLIDIDMSNGDE